MSSGAGHIQDMLNRVKQNNALKNARKKRFKGGNNYSNISRKKTIYDFPDTSKIELEKIKESIRKDAKKAHNKQLIIWLVGFIVLVIIFIAFNYY